MTAKWIIAVTMLAASGAAAAQSSGNAIRLELAEELDLFNLCPAEEHMDLLVDELPGHAAQAGLTTDAMRNAIESRLRGARIHDRNAGPLLRAAIVLGQPEEGHIPFYSIELSYHRELFAERPGLFALAETWSTGGTGQGDSQSFLAHLNSLVDEFMAAYARVRESGACLELRRQAASPSGGQAGG